ncbi:hypothetical protein RhiirC2_785217 [Rhizophagus irregularis]|uniref:Uncharacterized protein n=1 Tax=Rhizophagus irregularis TaxID=588596 RepID=A0A2N1MWZ5_9GLOM|nr:hypothetical protein RhiirC2_785217 [Rhizophagus irregularis]
MSFEVSASVIGLWIGFGFCPQAFNRFQLPIVFGIQDKCVKINSFKVYFEEMY